MANLSWSATRRLTLIVGTLLGISCMSQVEAADTDVIMIEEHWELQVGGPDVARSAPQVTMIMSPVDNIEGYFFAFTLNHLSFPEFVPGGYQLERWHGGECVDSKFGSQTSPIDYDGEVISWVQRLTISEGQVKFQVRDGQSQSWGQFGSSGFAMTAPTEITKLNGYRPAISLGQSGIGYAGNRVSSLVLQKLRWITADGEVHEMVAPIDIHLDLDP